MVSKQKPEQKQGGAKRIFAAIAVIAAALFLLAAAAPAAAPESSMQPAASTTNYTPAPTLNSNVSWSTFNSSWGSMEYYNGTSYANLSASDSTLYANPISINTADIVAKGILQNDNVTGSEWNAATPSTTTATGTGSVATAGNFSIGGVNEPYSKINATEAGATGTHINSLPRITVADLPSNNLAYDYITFAESFTGAAVVGASVEVSVYNGTTTFNTGLPVIYPGQSLYVSISLAKLQTLSGGKGYNITGNGVATQYFFQPTITSPAEAGSDYFTLTVSALALTEYPILLGENATGATPSIITGNAQLTDFHPSIPMLIYDNGYTVAVSQTMQNATEQQTSINAGSYTEQATYQGIFEMPTAPDLSYSASNITVPLTISGAQYEVANLNGVSYLSSIQTKTNGTFSFGTVNPNSQNSLILEVEYTTAQWDASSSTPSFFTLAGIEYYWWVTVLGLMGLIGLGSLAISHFGGEEETLRVPKGKFGR